jgi:hypothetical protein
MFVSVLDFSSRFPSSTTFCCCLFAAFWIFTNQPGLSCRCYIPCCPHSLPCIWTRSPKQKHVEQQATLCISRSFCTILCFCCWIILNFHLLPELWTNHGTGWSIQSHGRSAGGTRVCSRYQSGSRHQDATST